jgi:hypothetical protein
MATNATVTGLLEELGLGSIDEVAAMNKGMNLRGQQGSSTNAILAAQAEQFGMNIGMGVRALGNAIKGSKGEGKFDYKRAANETRDHFIAKGAGLEDGAALRQRRSIRSAVASQNFGDLSSADGRLKVAEFVLQQATIEGNVEAKGKALQKIDELKKEKELFDIEKGKKTAEANKAQTETIWINGENKSRETQVADRVDPVTGKKIIGREWADDQGQIQFTPVGQYTTQDPEAVGSGGKKDSIGKVWARLTGDQDNRRIRSMMVAGRESVRKYGRVLDTITDMSIQGNVDAVMSDAGTFTSWLDNGIRNLRGVASQIPYFSGNKAMDGKSKEKVYDENGKVVGSWSGLDHWTGEGGVASDTAHAIWDVIQLPKEMRDNSAAAQNYRAQIMDLMYMAARLAEPSNRGLSDNDIIAAAKKIGGNTANPAVMMRRFAEMMHDSAATLEDELDNYSGAMELEGYDRATFEKFIGGQTLANYRGDLVELRKKHNFTMDETTGRATFGSPIDNDINPGTGGNQGVAAPSDVALPEMSDEDVLKMIPE